MNQKTLAESQGYKKVIKTLNWSTIKEILDMFFSNNSKYIGSLKKKKPMIR